MYCPKCGKELESDATFCTGCGSKAPDGKKGLSTAKASETLGKVASTIKESKAANAITTTIKKMPKKQRWGALGVIVAVVVVLICVSSAGNSSNLPFPGITIEQFAKEFNKRNKDCNIRLTNLERYSEYPAYSLRLTPDSEPVPVYQYRYYFPETTVKDSLSGWDVAYNELHFYAAEDGTIYRIDFSAGNPANATSVMPQATEASDELFASGVKTIVQILEPSQANTILSEMEKSTSGYSTETDNLYISLGGTLGVELTVDGDIYADSPSCTLQIKDLASMIVYS